MKLTTIIAAVGQFPQDAPVLARALEIANIHDVRLTIVHVIDLPPWDQDIGSIDTFHGQAAFAARDRIEATLVGWDAGASKVDIRIEAGSPALRLIELCEEVRPDLIVMRAHQKIKISEKILGSAADRVIATGLVPVLIVKRPVDHPYSRVLVATNGFDEAPEAVLFVATLLPSADLHLVQAVQITPQLKEALLRVGTDQGTLSAHRDVLTKKAKAHLQFLSSNAPRHVTARVLNGDPVKTLIRATRSPKVDLITLGSGRANLIRRAFIGSVARRLLRDAACDVLVYCPDPRTYNV